MTIIAIILIGIGVGILVWQTVSHAKNNKHAQIKTVVWETTQGTVQFDYPVFPDLEVRMVEESIVSRSLTYLKKGILYTETPPPITIRNLALMSATPLWPPDDLVENSYGYSYVSWEKHLEY